MRALIQSALRRVSTARAQPVVVDKNGEQSAKEHASRSASTPEILWTVADDTIVIMCQDEAFLPWSDGAVYLARIENSPVYMPTTWVPSVPAQLLERALLRKFDRRIKTPFALLPEIHTGQDHGNATDVKHIAHCRQEGTARVISLSPANSLGETALLRQWLRRFDPQ